MRAGIKSILTLLAACLGLWLAGKFALPLVFPFLLGMVLALTAEPVVGLLCRRLGFPRGLAAGVGVTAVFLGISILLLMLCAFLVRELGMLAGILPDLTETARSGIILLRDWLLDLAGRTPEGIRPFLQQNVEDLFSGGTALLNKAFSYVLGLAGGVLSRVPDSALSLGTAVISGFMISARLPRIRGWIRKNFPREKLRPILETLKRVRKAVGGWLLAQLRLAGVTLVLLLAGMLILRIPYGALWALGISLVDAFPVLGTGTVLLPWSLICLLQGDRARALGLAGIYAVITLTRSVLEPKLVGRQLGLDPLATLFALYAGYKLWGFGGMILAPMAAVTVSQFLPRRGDVEK